MSANFHTFTRRLTGIGAAVIMAASLGTGAASAQSSMPQLPGLPTQDDVNNAVLGARDNIHAHTKNLPGEVRQPINQGVDNAVNFIAPGALDQREKARQAEAARHAEAKRQAELRSTPCPADAAVCVDINNRRTWLQKDGKVSHGPVVMSPGKPGQDTPRGTFHVTRKVKDEVSREFNNAPMPYAVYFTNQGHAFHQGTVNVESVGCVRLLAQDAPIFFNSLNVGDKVYIY